MATTLILFDDRAARAWEPFALTRPAGELLYGTSTLRERAERVLGLDCALHIAADHLLGFDEEGAPGVGTLEDVPEDRDRVFLLSRAVLEWDARPAWKSAGSGDGALRSGPIAVGRSIVGWRSPAGQAAPDPGFFLTPGVREGDPEPVRLPGRVLERVWELAAGNAARVAADAAALHPDARTGELPRGVLHSGDHPVIMEDSVELEGGCALDTSDGPIWLARGSSVLAFTRLAGPAYIGPESRLLGGSISSVSLGPVCRVRGEMSDTVCLGYTNKQHDGHLGHAYLGRWVNLGAATNNSDLKNNYSTIRMWTPDGDVDTGEIKLGSLLGDHVKTGIGLLLNTGTVVGAGSNLYGAAMPPKFVPPFSWGTGEELREYRLDRFLEVAERAMLRRGVHLSSRARQQLRRAWERGRSKWGTGPAEPV
jgi:UDP-N-acetylglucosamine diphosphorylase/glucosamine-1-phosphate N-acetyltransferase